jgi:uncharacterized membrane protein
MDTVHPRRHRHSPQSRWLYRRSRLLMAGIATLGAIEMAFLTVAKLSGSDICPTQGCDRVLSSPYASLFGLPLTLFGFLGYGLIVVLATAPLWVNGGDPKALRQTLDDHTWPLIFGVTTAMATFSLYLVGLMVTTIQAFCIFCGASAVFALLLFGLAVLGHRWSDWGKQALVALVVAMITLLSIMAIHTPLRTGSPPISQTGATGAAIVTTSGPAELALAQHLRDSGAVMYGTWWCRFCHQQKLWFGAEATAILPIVECDPQGQNSQVAVCQAQEGLQGYPTWKINGELHPGLLSLQQLAELSGYSGPMDFQNTAVAN